MATAQQWVSVGFCAMALYIKLFLIKTLQVRMCRRQRAFYSTRNAKKLHSLVLEQFSNFP